MGLSNQGYNSGNCMYNYLYPNKVLTSLHIKIRGTDPPRIRGRLKRSRLMVYGLVTVYGLGYRIIMV